MELLRPGLIVQWAFCLSVFSIPFVRLYLPGTGERLGVTRAIQGLIICAVLAQPRVCIRFVPIAAFWFLAYCILQVVAGLWLTPELRSVWWPRILSWLQFSLPWLWIMFNVLHFPGMGRRGLWALASGCSLCALLHIAGVGVVEVDGGIEGRSSIFGENANVMGATYAIAVIAMVGLAMSKELKLSRRLVLLSLMAVVAIGLAKTGSRGSALMLLIGVGILVFQGKSFGSRTKRFGALLLIGAVLGGIVWQIPTVMKRFERSGLDRQENRVRMMPVLADIFSRSPLYGSGPAGYESELLWRAMPHRVQYQLTTNAHNLFWKLLVETGIIGLLLFAAGVKLSVVGAWKARLKSCGSLPLALILPQVIAGIAFMDPSHHLVFWLAVAYGLAGEETC